MHRGRHPIPACSARCQKPPLSSDAASADGFDFFRFALYRFIRARISETSTLSNCFDVKGVSLNARNPSGSMKSPLAAVARLKG